ncbi:prolyl oligopeptidase family serine peptidase [Catenuloplanes japonicus]|uniref:prolyl oligopeptidase family serine peptidase n=1 Tax=Catenuloplanes japonicus TaxID=33876 RepID=UPI000525A06C|nr:prolyl oligopeptidase family serine peptidase [Catenuloplanes japonicus]
MSVQISRRAVLTAGSGAVAGLALPDVAAASADRSVGFTVDAEVLDGGEQVVSLTLGAARLGRIDPASLTPATFAVHVTATSPVAGAAGYDLDRTVTAVSLDRRGNIVIALAHGEGVAGAGTLAWLGSGGRNVRLNLAYTIVQNAPIVVRGRPVTLPGFTQGRLASPEVDAFTHHESASGMKYRLFTPSRTVGRRPLIVWLHGGGEGASLPHGYYDNETTLRANRGALGFATPEAQKIFSGAYVVAPQSTSFWMEDGPRFAPLINEIIVDVARRHAVDRSRIYVAGCSNGGYMSLKMTTTYPTLFAASIPVCGVVMPLGGGTVPLVPDADLAAITTPTWLVTSLDDTTVPPQPNTVHAAELIPGASVTLYDQVVRNGYRFPGHWSWIYLARNDKPFWQWMSRQRR